MKRAGFTFLKQKDGRYKLTNEKGKDIYVTEEELNNHSDEEILKAHKTTIKRNIKNKFANNKKIKQLFQEIFNVPMDRFKDFILSALTGVYQFDIIAFDKWLKTPDGISTKEYLKQRYSIQAQRLIQKLI